MSPKNDKHALILLGASVGLAVVGTVFLLVKGAGFLSVIPWVLPYAVAEFLGKSRNGI